MRIDIPAGAINAFGQGLATTAHNIANVNTDGFKPKEYHFETGPQGEGVQYVPQDQVNLSFDQEQPVTECEVAEPSQVDVATEMVDLINLENSVAANAAVVRSMEEANGVLIDTKV